jgi:hypothetical protein
MECARWVMQGLSGLKFKYQIGKMLKRVQHDKKIDVTLNLFQSLSNLKCKYQLGKMLKRVQHDKKIIVTLNLFQGLANPL